MTEPLPRLLIAMHAYPDGGGISSIVENMVMELEGRYEIHVAIVEEREGRKKQLKLPDSQVHVLGYTNAINPLLFPASILYALRVGRFLRRVVSEVRPALLIVKDGLNLPVPGLIAVRGSGGVPLAVMDHGTLTNVHEKGWAGMVAGRLRGLKAIAFRVGFALDAPWRAIRWRLGVRMADRLWYTGVELESWFGRAGSRSERYAQVVPNDFAAPTAAERAAARREFGLGGDGDDDRIAINMVGRLDGEKGLDTVLDALDRSPLAGAELLIAGDGSLSEWVEAEIARRGLGSQVRLLGRLDRDAVGRLQHASDVHLYAGTISCGVSICLLEAMAAAVVPVVSDVPIVQTSLVGSSGWVFPAGDAAALASALAAATSMTPAERAARGAEAAERIRNGQEGEPLALLIDRLAGSGAGGR